MARRAQKYQRNEVVHVLTPAFLVNSVKQACRYETSDGKLLTPGYYLALWPAGACHSSYSNEVLYFGPFSTRTEVWQMQAGTASPNIADTSLATALGTPTPFGNAQSAN